MQPGPGRLTFVYLARSSATNLYLVLTGIAESYRDSYKLTHYGDGTGPKATRRQPISNSNNWRAPQDPRPSLSSSPGWTLSPTVLRRNGSPGLLRFEKYPTTTLARCIKPFWFDEIVTYYLARMDSVAIAWRAIRDGADLQPPLMVALAHFSQRWLGPNEIATRLPAVLGVMVVRMHLRIHSPAQRCGFRDGRRRADPVDQRLPLLHGSPALRSRAGGAALALVSWQSADRPERGWASLAGIAAGLWIALASQCFSVLLAIPFGAGEIVRSVKRKRIDWPVWAAFGLSASAVLFTRLCSIP